MKPNIFIGSSVEGLDIAHAIQNNLTYEANCTVWTQNIFKLSSNSLDDLNKALDDFDFAIFVFKPDDLITVRDTQFNVVRDNVIFELGLFIGRLGKERVFFIIPMNAEKFHLPTDLLGVKPGEYDAKRSDGNLHAAVAPFCEQVRERIKHFVYTNIKDLGDESDASKKIAIEKKGFWEAHLLASLLRTRLKDINASWEEIRKGYVFRKVTQYDISNIVDWFTETNHNILRIV